MKTKKRFYEVYRYLKENSNEDHPVKAEEILTYLNSIDIEAERKAIYDDIKEMNLNDIAIEVTKKGYYYDDSLFSAAELKILLDLLNSSRFLTPKKVEEIENRLLSLTNKYDRKMLTNDTFNRTNSINEQLYYNVDAILKAINNKKQISFKYFDIDLNGKRKYREHDYLVCPYNLVINNNKYYMVCKSVKYDNLSNYRVDKMEKVVQMDDEFENHFFDINKYMHQVFGMFNGEVKCVSLEVDNDIYGEVLDQYGDNLMVTEKKNTTFICSVFTAITPTFMSWVFTFAGKIRILKPQLVVDKFKEVCTEMLDLHK